MGTVQHLWLGYLFVSFATGFACLGVAVGLVTRRRDALSWAFIAFYSAFSIMVTASLLLAFADSTSGVISATARQVLQYLESIVGFYGVMLTLPLLAHRVFRIEDPRSERVIFAAVLITLALQHVTEFALASTPWDQRGDWLEDSVFLIIVAYTCWTVYTHLRSTKAARPLGTRMFALMLLAIPGVCFDLFFGESLGLRVYPLWYGMTSVTLTWTLVRSEWHPEAEPAIAPPPATDGWGLSAREIEVADGVVRGLSNKEIAASLHISPNTVKTHLRAIFGKAGVGSRFELMAQMSGLSGGNHPKG